MLNKKLMFLVAFMATTMFLAVISCNKTTTELGSYTVSINMNVPIEEGEDSLNGYQADAYLFESDIAEAPLYTQTTTVADNEISFTMTEVTEGEYIVLVVIDYSDGESTYGPIGQGDLFWGTVDVAVESDLTIELTEDYWQRYHSVLFAVRGIPAGHNGQIIASALTEDSSDWFNLDESMLMGTYTVIYNNSALLAYSPVDHDLTYEQWLAFQLETDNYDVHFLLDHDGSYADYDSEEFDPFSEGDLTYSYDFAYDSEDETDNFSLITAIFEPLEFADITLTVYYNLPEDDIEGIIGDTVRLGVWASTVTDDPLYDTWDIVDGLTDTITLEGIHQVGTYLVALTIGDNSEEENEGFAAWAGLDVELSDDATITVQEQWWQWIESITVGVRDMPAGHDGEIVVFALFADDGEYTNFHNTDNFLMGGIGFVYNNAAVVSLHPNQEDEYWELSPGDYDLVALVDPDGDYNYYYHLDPDTIDMFMPYDVGDPYWIADYSYDTTESEAEFQILDGSFTEMLGIAGTVTCPPWISGGGNIYVFTFEQDPFDTSLADNDPFTWDIITQPGDYAMPIFPQYTGYVVAVWDANGNGLEGEGEGEGGPDEGDYVGGYGSSLDSLDLIEVLTADIANIDFAIDIPYSEGLVGD